MFGYVWWFRNFQQFIDNMSESSKPTSPTHLSVQTHQTHTQSLRDEQEGRRSAVAGGSRPQELWSATPEFDVWQSLCTDGPECRAAHWPTLLFISLTPDTSSSQWSSHKHTRSSMPSPSIPCTNTDLLLQHLSQVRGANYITLNYPFSQAISVYPSIHLSIQLSGCLSFNTTIHPYMYLSIHLTGHLSWYLFIHLSIHPFIY